MSGLVVLLQPIDSISTHVCDLQHIPVAVGSPRANRQFVVADSAGVIPPRVSDFALPKTLSVVSKSVRGTKHNDWMYYTGTMHKSNRTCRTFVLLNFVVAVAVALGPESEFWWLLLPVQ